MKKLLTILLIIISVIAISCSNDSNKIAVDTLYIAPDVALNPAVPDTIDVPELYSKVESKLLSLSGGFYKVHSLVIYYATNDGPVILKEGKHKVGPELYCDVIIEFLKDGIIQSRLHSLPYLENGWIHTEVDSTKQNYIIDKGKWAEFHLNLGKEKEIYWEMRGITHTKKMYPEPN